MSICGRRSECAYVAGELELVLLGGGDGDIDTGAAQDAADDLLADEVADLNLIAVILLLKVDVDGETGSRVSDCATLRSESRRPDGVRGC